MNLGPGTEALAPAGWSGSPELTLAAARTRVAVYHGRALARAGLVALLSEHAFEVVGDAPLHAEATPLGAEADVALVAASGHGASNVAHRLGYGSGTPVLMMLEGPADGETLLSVTASGASGCICSECPPERVIRALRAVAAGGRFFECTHRTAPRPVAPALLSERERNVVEELAGGAGTEEIAASLCISPHTVRTHVRNIKRKLNARTSAHAVATAISLRLVAPPSRSSLAPPPGSPA